MKKCCLTFYGECTFLWRDPSPLTSPNDMALLPSLSLFKGLFYLLSRAVDVTVSPPSTLLQGWVDCSEPRWSQPLHGPALAAIFLSACLLVCSWLLSVYVLNLVCLTPCGPTTLTMNSVCWTKLESLQRLEAVEGSIPEFYGLRLRVPLMMLSLYGGRVSSYFLWCIELLQGYGKPHI